MITFVKKWTESSLILKIIIGLIIGAILGLFFPNFTFIGFLGKLFVSILKAISPILVFILVVHAISKAGEGIGSRFKTVLILFFLTTILASIVAIIGSILFPVTIHLSGSNTANAPGNIADLMSNMILTSVSNPIQLLSEGQYLGILFWAIVFGMSMKIVASKSTLDVIEGCSDAVSLVVHGIIQLAPIGIMGLVFTSVSESGIGIFAHYGQLILLIVGCMAFVAFILDPIVSWILTRQNPYPLVFICLRESGITGFFSRSSAANIPVNLRLCERLGLDKNFFSITIPLGSTIHMEGSAISIIIITLALCHTLGVSLSLPIAIGLCLISSLAACASAGVAGGSLLLIPMASSLFGISSDLSMQAVAVGFIIGVIYDSCETALNSAGDVFFTATAEYYKRRKNREPVNYLGEFAK